MGFKNIYITLDNIPPKGYQPGSTIAGRVFISADKVIHIRSLVIKVYGEANVRFYDTVRRTRTNIRTVRTADNFGSRVDVEQDTTNSLETFTATERYISTSYTVLGETYIQPGEHEFDFNVILPSTIPSTFNGRHGGIRYWIAVKMDKAWNFDQVVKAEFKVWAPKELNNASGIAAQSLGVPIVRQDMKHFNFLCCRTGPLSLTVELPKTGVVPGETIQLTIDVDNATNVEITSVKIKIQQEVTWTAYSPTTNSTTTHDCLLTVHCPGVAKRDNRAWRQPIIVPDVPYINIDNCSIIKQRHYILVEAVPEGIHMSLDVKALIVIGTSPIGSQPVQRTSYFDPSQSSERGIVQPQPYGIRGFAMPQAPAAGFVPPDVGFVSSQNNGIEQPQPSAPMSYDFPQPEPPPPYPMTPDSYQAPEIYKKN